MFGSKLKRPIKILVSALITTMLLYSSYNIFALAAPYSFEYPSLGLIPVKLAYHSEMNTYFNDKISAFLDMDPQDPNYSAPKDDQECGEKNVSSYCVAFGALDRFMAYVKTLDEITPTLLNFQNSEVWLVGNPAATVTDIFYAAASNQQKVNAEKKHALAVMDAAVSAYNEFRLALPVHLKYEELIKELYVFIKNLKSLRMELAHFPVKFIDASSQSCK